MILRAPQFFLFDDKANVTLAFVFFSIWLAFAACTSFNPEKHMNLQLIRGVGLWLIDNWTTVTFFRSYTNKDVQFLKVFCFQAKALWMNCGHCFNNINHIGSDKIKMRTTFYGWNPFLYKKTAKRQIKQIICVNQLVLFQWNCNRYAIDLHTREKISPPLN